MLKMFKKRSPARIIAIDFASAILLGTVLLMLSCCVKDGVNLRCLDSLYTATSAVCVTGLVAVDVGDTFTPLGQFILAVLVQVGGTAATAIGAGFILAAGKKMDMQGRNLVQEAAHLAADRGVVGFIRDILVTTIIFESIGALLSFMVFVQDFPHTLWESFPRQVY